MSTPLVEELYVAALKRLQNYINRMAAQHVRRMREGWSKSA